MGILFYFAMVKLFFDLPVRVGWARKVRIPYTCSVVFDSVISVYEKKITIDLSQGNWKNVNVLCWLGLLVIVE